MTAIRTFRNSDLPNLVSVYNQNSVRLGHHVSVDAAQLEQAILSRSFFDRETLLLAVSEDEMSAGQVIAWMPLSLAAGDGGEPSGVIPLIACSDLAKSGDVAMLIDHAIALLAKQNVSRLTAGLVQDHSLGFAGLAPLGSGFGIGRTDPMVAEQFIAKGFALNRSVVRMVAYTADYRPAVNREMIQFRRSSGVHHARELPGGIRASIAMSHLDLERFALVDRAGTVIGGVDFWFSDSEAQVMPPSTALVDLPARMSDGKIPTTDCYLISAAIAQFEDRGVRRVETTVDADESALIDQLSRVCFQPEDDGAILTLRL